MLSWTKKFVNTLRSIKNIKLWITPKLWNQLYPLGEISKIIVILGDAIFSIINNFSSHVGTIFQAFPLEFLPNYDLKGWRHDNANICAELLLLLRFPATLDTCSWKQILHLNTMTISIADDQHSVSQFSYLQCGYTHPDPNFWVIFSLISRTLE